MTARDLLVWLGNRMEAEAIVLVTVAEDPESGFTVQLGCDHGVLEGFDELYIETALRKLYDQWSLAEQRYERSRE